MRWRRWAAPLVAVATVWSPVAGGHRAAGEGDGEGPIRAPTVAWQVEVDCASRSGEARPRCLLALSGDALYVHRSGGRHQEAWARLDATAGSPSASLSAYDAVTGARRWIVAAGSSVTVWADDRMVTVADKRRLTVLDPASGNERFEWEGRLLAANDYGTAIATGGADERVTALDGRTGEVLWTARPGEDLGALCRDVAILVPGADVAAAAFRVVDQRTGDERWLSGFRFEPGGHHLSCGAQSVYTTDGRALTARRAADGDVEWITPLPHGAAEIELYREVALVAPTDGSGFVSAVDRRDGELSWTNPAATIGALVSARLRVRRDELGLFTLSPTTGTVVNRADVPAGTGGTVRTVGMSDTRLVVVSGSVVTTLGAFDLGVAWSIDLGTIPDDVGVAAGTLVVRTGRVITGYR